MKVLFVLIALLMAGQGYGQGSAFDSIVVELTDLPINCFRRAPGQSDQNFESLLSCVLVTHPTGDSVVDGITFYYSYTMGTAVGSKFAPDTSTVSDFSYAGLSSGRITFDFASGPSTPTSTTIVVDMDSAQLAQTMFRYWYYVKTQESGGRHWISEDSSNGKLLTTTRVKVTYYKASPASAVIENPTQPLSWYPNPAAKRITYTSKLNTAVTVFDMHGKTVLSTIANEVDLDLNGLAPGIYFLRCNNKVEKLVVRPQ